MLTILNDPAGITGKRRHALDYRLTLQQNIERHLSGGGDAELRINGTVVDPLTDPRLDRPPGRFDLVTVSLRPRGLDPITWAYIAAGASAVLALALRRGSASARTPLLVWNALLVPVVVSLVQSGQVTLAALVAATVVVAVVAGLMATPGRS